MANHVDLENFTVALLGKAPQGIPKPDPSASLKPITREQAKAIFRVAIPLELPGGFKLKDIVYGEGNKTVLINTYSAATTTRLVSSLTFVLIPRRVYHVGANGKRLYQVLGDSLEEEVIAGRRAAVARRRWVLTHPGSLSIVWERLDLLALVVTSGLEVAAVEEAMGPIA